MAEKESKKYEYVRKSIYWEGKRYFVRGKTEAEAYKKLGELKAALKRGEVGISNNMTVKHWSEEWLKNYITPKVTTQGGSGKRGMTAKSHITYTQKLDGYIFPAIGPMKLKDVKDIHLRRILNKEAGRSFSHVSKIRMVMQKMFSQARKSHLILYDPSEDLELPYVEKNTRRSLTDYEREILHTVAETQRCGLWIEFLLGTGIRPGESSPLQWKDLDLNKAVLHITKAVESGSKEIKEPKTKAGTRDIPIPDSLLGKLRQARTGKTPFDFVFPQTDGVTMMTQTTITKYWNSFKRAMDVAMGAKTHRNKVIESVVADDLVLYCLRHTYCTDLQVVGIPINIAKYLMGHSDISVTSNIYTHENDKTIALAAARINAATKGDKEQLADTKER